MNGQLKQQLSSYSKLETMSQDKRVVAGSNEQILLQRECFRSYYEEGVLDTFWRGVLAWYFYFNSWVKQIRYPIEGNIVIKKKLKFIW